MGAISVAFILPFILPFVGEQWLVDWVQTVTWNEVLTSASDGIMNFFQNTDFNVWGEQAANIWEQLMSLF